MAYLRAKLLELRREHHRGLRRELAVPTNELRLHPGDSSDAAEATSVRETAVYMAELEASELEQIDEALAKIKKGTYGICEECGDRISGARLKAVPFASLCIRCKEREEKAQVAKERTPRRWRDMVNQRSDVFDPIVLNGSIRGRRLG